MSACTIDVVRLGLASSQSVLLLPTLLDLSLTVHGTSFYNWNETVVPLGQLYEQARIPVQGKSSVCLILYLPYWESLIVCS